MVSGNSKNDKGKSKKVVASVAKPVTGKKPASSVSRSKPVVASRTKFKVVRENRLSLEDIEAEMQLLTTSLVENVEHVLSAIGKTWSDLSGDMGLGRSTVYQFKNGRANAGATMAIRIAKALDLDSWALFLPHDKFQEYFKANFKFVRNN